MTPTHFQREHDLQGSVFMLLAVAAGIIAANIYYAQPLIGLISRDLGMQPEASGLIVTLTQIGYGAGLLFIVPLSDLIENRKLVLTIMVVGVLALATASTANTAALFLAAAVFIGFGSVVVQILVPYAAHLAPERVRGQMVGKVMSGLLLGIMLARPVASTIAAQFGWRAVFVFSAGLVAALAGILSFALPRRKPAAVTSYGALIVSLWALLLNTPVLRERAAYHAALFGAFSLFWTAVPLFLAGPAFQFTQLDIALFALAGVAGAFAAPVAGRLADRGHGKVATFWAIVAAAASFVLSTIGAVDSILRLVLLVCAAVLLDMAVSANLVLGQREIFLLAPEQRGRLNGLYLALFFVGGAIGSALGGWSFAAGGWKLSVWVGVALPLTALIYFLIQIRKNTCH